MVVVRSPVRPCVRSVVRDVFGVVDGQTDLQRILALSPSLLIWPANGAGWQGTSGGTLAASGQPLGLGVDLAGLGGKTLSEWLATAPELVTNGSFDVDANWGTLFGATISGGKLNCNVTGSGNQIALQTLAGSAGAYAVTLTISGYSAGNLRIRMNDAGSLVSVPASNGTHTVIVISTTTNPVLQLVSTGGTTTLNVDEISTKTLPGNHLRAGTWASPSDAARATLQVSGGATWIDPDATSDAYSFLTALSARAIVARVRVPTGYSNADRFLTNDAETVNVSADAGSWTNTGSGSTRINGASGAAFTVDTWQTLTIEWGSGQAFSRMWYSATGTLFGSMDVASLAVFNSALTSGDRAIVEAVIGATA